jgi:hypothetical protein
MNLLLYWKWIACGVAAFIVFSAFLALYSYDKGKASVYQNIAAAPVQRDTVLKYATLPAPPPVIKWLKPEKVFETPPEAQAKIDSLGNDATRLKALLAEKAKPFETKMDSARFYLQILTNPWSRTNKINLQLKPVPFQYPEITNTQLIARDPPWWHDVLKIGGSALAGYGIARIVSK